MGIKDEKCNEVRQEIRVEEGYVRPFGIPNIGNTCYMNSAIQCISSLPSFISNLNELTANSKSPNLLTLFSKFIEEQDRKQLAKIKQIIASKNEEFYGYSQQDSYEFTTIFIDLIRDENEKGINDLFIEKFNSILVCKNCLSKTVVNQNCSSFNLSIKEALRINYVPFSLTDNVVRLAKKPTKFETVKIQSHFLKKVKIQNYLLVAKMNKKYEIVDQILPQYPYIYAFELPDQIKDGFGLIIIQFKTKEKAPISSPFLCEVPLKNFDENQLKSIILERTKDIHSKSGKIEGLSFTKSFEEFTFSEKLPLISEHLSVIVSNEENFDFKNRSEILQDLSLNLVDLFNGLIRQSQIERPGKWTCDDCGKMTLAYHRINYTKFPEILIFQLKRSNDFDLPTALPDQTKISFPSQISVDNDGEFNKIEIEKKGGLKYELRSICHHSGSFRSGHYWACGKRGSEWFLFNDNESPRLIKVPTEATSTAYMAFYEKVPNSPRKTKIICKEIEKKKELNSNDYYISFLIGFSCVAVCYILFFS